MKTPSTKRVVRAWAVVSRGGVLIGGGDRIWGYTALCVYSTKIGAKQNMSRTRPTDKIVPCTITFSLPKQTKTRSKK